MTNNKNDDNYNNNDDDGNNSRLSNLKLVQPAKPIR